MYFVHGVTMKQIAMLHNKFAYLTPAGWVIPDWLKLLAKDAK